jgi:hypothetical protein
MLSLVRSRSGAIAVIALALTTVGLSQNGIHRISRAGHRIAAGQYTSLQHNMAVQNKLLQAIS